LRKIKVAQPELLDTASTGQPAFMLKAGELTPDTLHDFILAATTYGGWKTPLDLRDYQMKVAWDIVESLINKRGLEISAMFSRQSGKTTSISGATNFFISALSSIYEPMLKAPMRVGIFGPKKEQADYAFDMYKQFIDTGFLQDYLGVSVVLSNKSEVRLTNGSRCHCESASKNASIERYTLDLAILEEAQNIEDTRILNSIYPMCASTNGTRILIGTPTPDHSGYFYKLTSRRGQHNHRADWRECARYSKPYEAFVQKEMRRHGQTSDYFKTQYELEWSTNVINFCTLEELAEMRYGEPVYQTALPVVAGLDTARITDSTVLTIVQAPQHGLKPHVCMWAEWQGDDTKVQAKDVTQILSNFPGLQLMNIDTLHGIGHGIADMLPTNLPIARYPMEPVRQAWMWQIVREAIVNRAFTYPDVLEPTRFKFEEQMTDLRTKYLGDKLKVEAPSGRNDDYADSFALAWAAVAELYYIGNDNIPPATDAEQESDEVRRTKPEVIRRLRPVTSLKKPRVAKPRPGRNSRFGY
jgi:hypothetical protein